jgi:hypothetical protein
MGLGEQRGSGFGLLLELDIRFVRKVIRERAI